MKKTAFVFLSACSLLACDENGEKKKVTATTPSQEQQLLDAINKYPDSFQLKGTLIQYYSENGNYDAALGVVDKAIAKDSLNPDLWDLMGSLQFQNEDTLNAIRSFERAVKILPDPQFIIALGTLYAQTRNPLALKMADSLLAVDKTNANKESLFIKGLFYTNTNEKLKAISYFDQCLSISFTYMDAYREKAIALYDLGKYNDALAVLDKALTIQNRFDEGYYYSGKCLEKLNRIPEAIESYQNALKIDPDYLEAKDALGKLGIKS